MTASDNTPANASLIGGWREWLQHEADLQMPGATQVVGALKTIEQSIVAAGRALESAGLPSAPGEGRVSALGGDARADSEMAGRVGVSSNYLQKSTVGGVAAADPAKPGDERSVFDKIAERVAGGPGVMTVVIGGVLFLLARGARP